MRFTVISAAIFLAITSCYSVDATLEGSASHNVISVTGVSGIPNKAEKRSFTSRSRAFTRENHQRRNGSLLPNIVLPSITPAQPAPAAAPPAPQAVSYPAAQGYSLPQTASYPVTQPITQPATSYPPPQTANYPPAQAVNYLPQPPVQNYSPQPNLALPTLVQAPAKKEEDDDDEDEEEEDEDEEDEEDYDADDLVTRRRR
ncbi:hypothetical protein BD408DRAFT_426856 [Parasitella parasitica]|nr:hypothetical protein BD408DRAFT_426856 [Parasitella parasitica]